MYRYLIECSLYLRILCLINIISLHRHVVSELVAYFSISDTGRLLD
jgi:hypothetical protein